MEKCVRLRIWLLVALATVFSFPVLTSAGHAESVNPAIQSTAVVQDWWLQRHNAKLQQIRQGPVDLVFIGDSITNDYEFNGGIPQYDFLAVWKRFYGDRQAVNLGFSGDTTANVLWRLDNGEIDGIAPKIAVVLIGTNNTSWGQTAENTTAGIEAVVATIHEKLPHTKVLLLGILPSGISPQKSKADAAVNMALKREYAKSAYVTFLDISSVFMKNGVLDQGMFMDPHANPPSPALHPDAFAQAKMAEAIEPTLARLMGDKSKVGSH